MANTQSKDTNNPTPRRHYADPTADQALRKIMKEEKAARKEKERELKKLIISDLTAVLNRAELLESKTLNFYSVPIENVQFVLTALKGCGKGKH